MLICKGDKMIRIYVDGINGDVSAGTGKERTSDGNE